MVLFCGLTERSPQEAIPVPDFISRQIMLDLVRIEELYDIHEKMSA